MKTTDTGEANVGLEGNNSVKIDFVRKGKKGGAYTKELFWLSRKGGYTLNDLRTIATEAEKLLNLVNE